jgi:hypothetical protein
MLKFTYTETGITIERVNRSLEELVMLRVVLAMRVGQRLIVEPGTATFLLSANLQAWHLLDAVVRRSLNDTIALCQCDADSIEVSLRGTWIAQTTSSEEGIFLAELGDALPGTLCERAEFIVFKLWRESSACQSSLR